MMFCYDSEIMLKNNYKDFFLDNIYFNYLSITKFIKVSFLNNANYVFTSCCYKLKCRNQESYLSICIS